MRSAEARNFSKIEWRNAILGHFFSEKDEVFGFLKTLLNNDNSVTIDIDNIE